MYFFLKAFCSRHTEIFQIPYRYTVHPFNFNTGPYYWTMFLATGRVGPTHLVMSKIAEDGPLLVVYQEVVLATCPVERNLDLNSKDDACLNNMTTFVKPRAGTPLKKKKKKKHVSSLY